MADSRRVIQGNQNRYRSAALDAALGREAHREQAAATPTRVSANPNAARAGGTFVGGREAQSATALSPAAREAHLETAAERATPSGTVSASGLQRLGALLQRDENLARKLAKNPRRALAGLDFISEREKQVLAGIDTVAWDKLAEAAGRLHVTTGEAALAGISSSGIQDPNNLTGVQHDPGFGPLPGSDGGSYSPGSGFQHGSGRSVFAGLGGARPSADGFEPASGPDVSPGGLGSNDSEGQGAPHSGRALPQGIGGGRGGPASEIDNHPPGPTQVPSPPSPPPTFHVFLPGTAANPTPSEYTIIVGGQAAIDRYNQGMKDYEDEMTYRGQSDIRQWKKELEANPPAAAPKQDAPPPPKDPTGTPNPEDPRGPGPVGPQSRVESSRGQYTALGRYAVPNDFDPRGPAPVGPQSTGRSSGGVYSSTGRYAIPNEEDPRGPRPVGPQSRTQSRNRYGTYRDDALPDPDASRGTGGPVGPAN